MAMYYSAKPTKSSLKPEGWGVKKDSKSWLERKKKKKKKNDERGET